MIYLFDIDGTLTEPQKPISDEMTDALLELQVSDDVFLVTGSDRALLIKNGQINERLDHNLSGIFTCQGSMLHINGEPVHEVQAEFPNEIIDALHEFLDESDFSIRAGNHIVNRPGMINFTIVGRDATPVERLEYSQFDKTRHEREYMADVLRNKFPDYDFMIGGEISIDISPKGVNKSQVIKYLKDHGNTGFITFFGDKTFEGGNDFVLADALRHDGHFNVIHQVQGPQETLQKLQRP